MRLSKMFASRIAAFALTAVLTLGTSAALAQEDPPLDEARDTDLPLGAASWTVTMPNGDFTGTVEDMNVKVLGGFVRVTREYAAMRWKVNPNWGGLTTEDFLKQYIPGYYFVIGSCYVSDPREDCIPSGGSNSVATLPDYDPYPAQINGVWFDRNFGAQEYGRIGVLYRNGVGFKRRQGGVFVLENQPRYLIREVQVPTIPNSNGPDSHPPAGIPGAGGLPVTLANGYRWQDRGGSFIEYDTRGRLVSYGDRNNNRVWLQYNSANRVERVLDHFGKTVITLHYTGDLLTEVRDYLDASLPVDLPQRRVNYEYDSGGKLHRVTDVRGNVTVYNYTGSRLTEIADPEGRIKTVTYGPTGRVASIVEPDSGKTEYDYSYDKGKKHFYIKVKAPETPAGRRVEDHTYDDMGRMVRMDVNGRTELEMTQDGRVERYTDGRGNVTETRRNEYDQPVSETYGDGSSIAFTYDSRFLRLAGYRDENGASDTYEYDEHGNLRRAVEAVGLPEQRTTIIETDERGLIRSETREAATVAGILVPAATVRREYDERGSQTTGTDAEGNLTRYEYDRAGNLRKVTDPRGGQWVYTYDAAGNMLTSTTPLLHSYAFEYDRAGNLQQVTDPRGKLIEYEYDGANRQTKTIDAYGKAYTYQYNGWGLTTKEIDEDGRETITEYDRDARPSRMVDARGNVVEMAYLNDDGTPTSSFMPTQVKYPTFRSLHRYDARNRLIMQTDLQGDEGRVSSYRYDRRGNQTEMTDENGRTRYFTYDAFGRPTRITDSLGANTDFTWDTRGNLLRVRYPDGNVRRFEYDRSNQMLGDIMPLGETTSYLYDANGNVRQVTDANGTVISHTYDASDRLEQATVTPAGATQPAQTYTFVHDQMDELLSWTDGTLTGTYTYDDNGQPLTETINYGNGVTLGYAYEYTDAGRKRTLVYPDGTRVGYEYDLNGELSTIAIPGEGTLAVSEWNWIVPRKLTLPGGTVRELTYDGLLNVTGVRVKNPGQQTVFDLAADYGDAGELLERTIDQNASTYRYNEEQRLERVSTTNPASVETFTTDTSGNRVTHNGGPTWEYDANERLIRRGDVVYEYDAAGNLIRKTVGTSGSPGSITEYRYDGFGRLTEVLDGASATIARYGYDPFDRRLWKEVGGVRTLYLYSDEGLLAEATSAGAVTVQYGWKADSEWATDPVFVRTVVGQGPSAQVGYAYLHNDQLGTPMRATDKNGNVVWGATYNAFGQAQLHPTNQISQNLRLAGQYFDAETGLHYNTRRYYEPQTGRYITQDPQGIEGGWNPYLYADADPMNNLDPTGEWIWVVIRVAITVYDVYTSYKEISENGLCADWTRLIPFPVKVPKLKWLTKRKKICSCGCDIPNSFVANTPVHVRDANGEPAIIPISEVKVGTEVLSWAEWKQPEQALSYQKVLDVVSSERPQELVHLELSTGETISATRGHPLRTTEGWRDAVLVQKGAQLLMHDRRGKGELETATVLNVRTEHKQAQVFNLEVANAHTFFVGDQGSLVHNGIIYRVPGCATPSGKPYIGRTKHNHPKKRRGRDGRDRSKATIVDRYPSNDTAAGRRKEQKQIDRNGGVPKLDNKRNEICKRCKKK